MRIRPDARPRFSTVTMTSAAFRPRSWRLPRKPPADRQPTCHQSPLRRVAVRADDLRQIDSAASKITVEGTRYPENLEQMSGR